MVVEKLWQGGEERKKEESKGILHMRVKKLK